MTKVTMPAPVAYIPMIMVEWVSSSLRTDGAHGGTVIYKQEDESSEGIYTTHQMEAYAAAKFREALELAAATVVKGINERSSLIANVTRRNAASEILALTPSA